MKSHLSLPLLAALCAVVSVATSTPPANAQTAHWVKQMGTSGISNGVSSDAAGNAYATGIVGSPGLFDDVTIPCNVSDVFLTKYDTAGNLLWATTRAQPKTLRCHKDILGGLQKTNSKSQFLMRPDFSVS